MECMCQPGHCAIMHGWSHAIIRFVVSQASLIILQAVWLWYKSLHARDLHSTAHTSYLGLGCVRVQLWPAVVAIGRVQRAIGIHGPKEKATGELICTSTMLDLIQCQRNRHRPVAVIHSCPSTETGVGFGRRVAAEIIIAWWSIVVITGDSSGGVVHGAARWPVHTVHWGITTRYPSDWTSAIKGKCVGDWGNDRSCGSRLCDLLYLIRGSAIIIFPKTSGHTWHCHQLN